MGAMARWQRFVLIGVAALAVSAVVVVIALRSPRVIALMVERQARQVFGTARNPDLFDGKALRVILCGTSSPLADPNRAKACTMVIAGGRAYVVDTGPESAKTLGIMGFPFERIDGVFLTHFHSDHFGGLGEFRLFAWIGGRQRALPVYGPAGVEKITAGFNLAYEMDDRHRADHHGPDIAHTGASLLEPRPFAVGASQTRDKSEVILDEDGLKITAFEVNHLPVRPAVGYRFDYKGRSVVISGDTTKWHSVAAAAKGADILVHEAQAQNIRKIIADAADAAGNKRAAKLMRDIESYHASPVDAAEIANEAGVKLLVYSHFTPPLNSTLLYPLFFDGVAAKRATSGWVAGFDSMRIDLPIGSDAIVQSRVKAVGE